MKFESFKNARVVRSSWLEEGGRRLDCNPYMSGALEARETLKSLNAPKEPLKSRLAAPLGLLNPLYFWAVVGAATGRTCGSTC